MAYTVKDEIKSWRQGYHYQTDGLSDIGVNDIETNSTIKPIDRDKANLEAEKGEIVFQPDGTLHKVLGNSHAKDGTPLNLPAGSFIYSRYKKLNISKQNKELFEFKEGGSYSPSKNTPAKILEREVKLPHHNKMLAILGSEAHDKISKTSAQLMVAKNLEKIGQVAYLQEEKKDFPNGVPDFAQGTAPLITEDLRNDIDMTEQYKLGGFTQLNKFQTGGSIEWDGKKWRKVDKIPDGYKPAGSKANRDFASLSTPGSSSVAGTAIGGGKPSAGWRQSIIDRVVKQHVNPQDLVNGKFIGKGSFFNELQALYKPPTEDNVYTEIPIPTVDKPTPPVVTPPNTSTIPATPYTPPETDWEYPDQPLPYYPNVPLTPQQKKNLGYAAFNAVNIPKYGPTREQYSYTPLRLQRVNAQPYINAANQQTQGYIQNTRLYNPILNRANASQALGQSLDQTQQILSQVDTQNVGIANQEAMANNQMANQTAAQNVNANGQYNDQVARLNQNYDRERRTATSEFMSLDNQFRSQNDALEMQLASQPTFGSVWIDPKSGKRVSTQGKSDKQLFMEGFRKQSAPLYDYDSERNRVFYTGAGSLDLLSTQQMDPNFLYQKLAGKVSNQEPLSSEEARILSSIIRYRK